MQPAYIVRRVIDLDSGSHDLISCFKPYNWANCEQWNACNEFTYANLPIVKFRILDDDGIVYLEGTAYKDEDLLEAMFYDFQAAQGITELHIDEGKGWESIRNVT